MAAQWRTGAEWSWRCYRSVRHAVGRDYPVLIKINSEDYVEGGFSTEDMFEASELLEKAGIDAIEVSGGTGSKASRYRPARLGTIARENEGFYRDAARLFSRGQVPLILVGANPLAGSGGAPGIGTHRRLYCSVPPVNLRT